MRRLASVFVSKRDKSDANYVPAAPAAQPRFQAFSLRQGPHQGSILDISTEVSAVHPRAIRPPALPAVALPTRLHPLVAQPALVSRPQSVTTTPRTIRTLQSSRCPGDHGSAGGLVPLNSVRHSRTRLLSLSGSPPVPLRPTSTTRMRMSRTTPRTARMRPRFEARQALRLRPPASLFHFCCPNRT
jgi:hypothetical protein